jgi:hypothetical protein
MTNLYAQSFLGRKKSVHQRQLFLKNAGVQMQFFFLLPLIKMLIILIKFITDILTVINTIEGYFLKQF